MARKMLVLLVDRLGIALVGRGGTGQDLQVGIAEDMSQAIGFCGRMRCGEHDQVADLRHGTGGEHSPQPLAGHDCRFEFVFAGSLVDGIVEPGGELKEHELFMIGLVLGQPVDGFQHGEQMHPVMVVPVALGPAAQQLGSELRFGRQGAGPPAGEHRP